MSSMPGARDAGSAGEPAELKLPTPYLLFLGDVVDESYAKTAFGLRDWAPEHCVGESALPGARVTTGLRKLTAVEARSCGARGLLIGVASPGGRIPAHWLPALSAALEAGLDIVAGMHTRLADIAPLRELAARLDRRLIDVRTPPRDIPIASGKRRTGWRVLTMGTDCAIGKKYTALAITRALQTRGVDATFRATGQTGIMIAGGGIPIDAVVADFIAGAAEILSPDAPARHVDVIEGQGSLFHPSYAAVTLGLLHGSQPDAFVVCHEPGRTAMVGTADYLLPKIEDVIALTLAAGRLTNSGIRCAGVSLNTGRLDARHAAAVIEETARQLGLPVADPLRGGPDFERLVDRCLG
ncbi:MAG: DUF1611 domain-containing protein [Steroidobacteraceae bacterium]|nr:DUF1611 domain-containing protein [Steroidobacteraceae bacterium]